MNMPSAAAMTTWKANFSQDLRPSREPGSLDAEVSLSQSSTPPRIARVTRQMRDIWM